MAVGQTPVPPVSIPIPTNRLKWVVNSPTPKWDPIGFDPQPYVYIYITMEWDVQASCEKAPGSQAPRAAVRDRLRAGVGSAAGLGGGWRFGRQLHGSAVWWLECSTTA